MYFCNDERVTRGGCWLLFILAEPCAVCLVPAGATQALIYFIYDDDSSYLLLLSSSESLLFPGHCFILIIFSESNTSM